MLKPGSVLEINDIEGYIEELNQELLNNNVDGILNIYDFLVTFISEIEDYELLVNLIYLIQKKIDNENIKIKLLSHIYIILSKIKKEKLPGFVIFYVEKIDSIFKKSTYNKGLTLPEGINQLLINISEKICRELEKK